MYLNRQIDFSVFKYDVRLRFTLPMFTLHDKDSEQWTEMKKKDPFDLGQFHLTCLK